MNTLPETILQQAQSLPDGGVLWPNEFLHLGSRSAVDQAFSRLAKAGKTAARGSWRLRCSCLQPVRCSRPRPREGRQGAGRAKWRSRRAARCQRRQCLGPDPASADPRGLFDFRPHPEIEARAFGNTGETRAALDAGTGCAAGRHGRACAGLGGAHARRQVAHVATPYPSPFRVERTDFSACNAA